MGLGFVTSRFNLVGWVAESRLKRFTDALYLLFWQHTIEISHHPDLEKRAWDIEYAELDQSALCELASVCSRF